MSFEFVESNVVYALGLYKVRILYPNLQVCMGLLSFGYAMRMVKAV